MTRTPFLLASAVVAAALAGRGPAPAQTPEKAAREVPDEPGKDAEPLPPPPVADPKSKVTPLNPDKTLFLEVLPDGKTRRVLLSCEVCLREGPLEVFLCKKNTKEHEAVLRVDADARQIALALEATGAKKGTPVQFVNPKTREADYKPATGSPIKVTLHYRKGGQLHTHAAQEWVWNHKKKAAMDAQWVFAGSREIRDEDRPKDPPYYAANNGEVISISNFPEAMMDLPVEVSRDDESLSFEAKTARIPPLLSKVWVVLEPAAAKK